jgi:long-chain acyl-CoA synthetase
MLLFLNDCKPEVIFYSNGTKEICEKAIAQLNHKIEKINLDEIKIEESKVNAIFPEANPNETAVIIYTSGTTGSPKGVMLSYDNLLVNIEAVTTDVNVYKADDKVMVLLPLHHIFPLMGTMVIPLSVGGTIVFSPSMASEDIMTTLQHGITIIIGVPRLYNLIRKEYEIRLIKVEWLNFFLELPKRKTR